ncbi:zinc-binding dehydrogenase [Kribbella sp. NPDC051770]|uniref:quinone oxidoreductase family protein n=1 Tax=Kribbella sp. NPDC051770 TaxID=3155413 RepID=UPI003414F9D1
MRAALVTRFGDPEVFELTELPDPAPAAGEIAIDVSHAAVGLIDVFLRQGLMKDRPGLPQPPYVPGLEVAGTVRAVGPGVSGFRVGEPVVTLAGSGPTGGYASIAVVAAVHAISLDGTGIDPALAVAAVPNAVIAHLALTQAGDFKPSESLLVHGAYGGLASAFPGMARLLGAAAVVGTSRGAPAASDATPASAGEAHGLPYDQVVPSDFVPALDGQLFDVMIDPVGGQLRTDSLQVMAPMGRMILVGNGSDDWAHTVPTNELWLKNLALRGFNAGLYLSTRQDEIPAAAAEALRAVQEGLLPLRTHTLPLADAAEAHRRLEKGGVGGRLLLTP